MDVETTDVETTDIETTDIEPDPELGEMLHRVAPTVTVPVAAQLRAMATATIEEQRRATRRKRAVTAAVLVPGLLVVGAGAAYAATTIDWSTFWGAATTTEWADWAQNPDAVIEYTLPGGGSCELRLGEFSFAPDPDRPSEVTADPRSLDATLAYLHNADVMADANVAGVIKENRSDQNWTTDGDGNTVPFGYGTENYNPDVEYSLAVQEALHDAISAHLDGLGIPTTGLFYQGQEQCTGMTK